MKQSNVIVVATPPLKPITNRKPQHTTTAKIKSTTGVLPSDSEPPQNPESKIKKKKKKKNKQRNKDKAEEPKDNNPKRKHEEIEAKEKESKNKKSKEDDKESKTHQGKEKDETVKDGLVVVSGHNVKLGKYAPLKSFFESGLPQEVLECSKNFQSPSSIQSGA
ncbi:DEAD-box ATP-dependent RNA helicase 5 [Quercus suber]|uniref:DEAD-box ATP-dependent RNA helicase 5 n=1 Tax=Quercus suber TaxID=58331 RepID=UPI000CE1739D|nr:DEAD-box ATP-dependent RNA helicase 5-like [Quercus suber]POF01999.1 dead-box atp-dependent rna helicase 5 [Quercus suber]